jgi:hypothetical protein
MRSRYWAEAHGWLRQTGRRYIIGAPKSELRKFGSALARADGWRTIQEGVEVTQPDPAQAALLDRLGIILPKRMRLFTPSVSRAFRR